MSVVFPIEEDDRYRIITASAGQAMLAIPFPWQDDEDIELFKLLDGAWLPLSRPADFALTGAGNEAGGSATLTAAASAGDKFLVVGAAVLDRLSSVVRDGRFRSKLIDDEFDRNRIIQQELSRDLGRAVKVDFGASPQAFPAPESGKFLGWSGDLLTNLMAVAPGSILFGPLGEALALTASAEQAWPLLKVRVTANSREAAATMNLANVDALLVNRYTNVSALAPLVYEKVPQPANSEPTSLMKFQDANGLWFQGVSEQFTPAMLGVPLDGVTPAYTLLQALFNVGAGKEIVMPRGVKFEIGNSVLSVADGTTVHWNNNEVRRSVSINTYGIEISGANVTFKGLLKHTTIGERGIRVVGDNFQFDKIRIISDTPGMGDGNILKDAFRIEKPTSVGAFDGIVGVKGDLYIENFNIGLTSKGAEEIDIYLRCKTFRTGFWLRDTRHSRIRGGWAKGGSPTNKGQPGENGGLIEATVAFATSDIYIENFAVVGSGEHGNRIGGQAIVANVWYVNCRTKDTGIADGTGVEPDDHGGCGFKALGPTSIQGAHHQNINFVNCVVEDIRYSTDTDNNFAGFNIGKCYNVSIVHPIVRRSMKSSASDPYVEPTYSCLNGIEIIGSAYVHITNPAIDRPYLAGVMYYDTPDTADTFWGQQNWYHTVTGGRVLSPRKYGVYCYTHHRTMRRIAIQGLEVEGGETALLAEVKSGGTGGYTQCSAEMMCLNQTVETVLGTSTWYLALKGTSIGTGNPASNGSTWADATTGALRHRKAGAWVTL